MTSSSKVKTNNNMAVNLIRYPKLYQSAYNPTIFRLGSNLSSNAGFRYILEILDPNDNNSLFRRLEFFPNKEYNMDGVIDISRVLQDKLDFTIPSDPIGTNMRNHYFEYTFRTGEKYIYSKNLGNLIIADNNEVTLGATSHSFVVGDLVRVNIEQGGTEAQRELLNRVWRVSGVSANNIRINEINNEELGASLISGIVGSVKYANNRLVEDFGDIVAGTRFAINTALPYLEFVDTQGDLYDYSQSFTEAHKGFLTSAPKRIEITLNQPFFFNSIGFDTPNIKLFFQTNEGNVFVQRIKNFPVTGFDVGTTANPDIFESTEPELINDTVKYYDVWYGDDTWEKKSPVYRFVIDRRCKINDVGILFMDRKGAFGSFSFQLKKKKSIETDKESFNTNRVKDIYTDEDKIENIFSADIGYKFTLNTNWMSEDMNLYFEELISSRVLLLSFGDDRLIPIKIKKGNYRTELKENSTLLRRTIDVEIINREKIN